MHKISIFNINTDGIEKISTNTGQHKSKKRSYFIARNINLSDSIVKLFMATISKKDPKFLPTTHSSIFGKSYYDKPVVRSTLDICIALSITILRAIHGSITSLPLKIMF